MSNFIRDRIIPLKKVLGKIASFLPIQEVFYKNRYQELNITDIYIVPDDDKVVIDYCIVPIRTLEFIDIDICLRKDKG